MNPIARREQALAPVPQVRFTLDGRAVSARADRSLLQIARDEGIEIAHLCFKEGLDRAGNCRVCMVEIDGERTLAASCCRMPSEGMKVSTQSERALKSQRLVLELLLADMPEATYTRHNELDDWAAKLKIGKPRFAARAAPQSDLSHPAMAVNLDACIQCTRCVRACRDEQVNDVIGLAFRGEHTKIVFDFDDAMGASTCVACGECVQACPTGALASVERVGVPASVERLGALSSERDIDLQMPVKLVDSLCPFCGVGCQLTYHV